VSNGTKKTITSGPMMETLSLFGTVTEEKFVGGNRVDLTVKLDDEIKVKLVPQGKANENDPVELELEIGIVEVKKKSTRSRGRRRPR